eukprot:5782112-Prorocentrum_lima.AAC.1
MCVALCPARWTNSWSSCINSSRSRSIPLRAAKLKPGSRCALRSRSAPMTGRAANRPDMRCAWR